MILSAQSIRALQPVIPFFEQTSFQGMTFGLGPNGYDIRIAEDLIIKSGEVALASSIERFYLPSDVMARVSDKSTWARRFLSVFNTTIDAGWAGFLTLELVNHSKETILINSGSPIAKIIFERLDQPTVLPYSGKYQNQSPGPQEAQLELSIRTRSDVLHIIRQESDEYACMCGMRWDVAEGEEHP